jgi:phenylacetate-CoA ligase
MLLSPRERSIPVPGPRPAPGTKTRDPYAWVYENVLHRAWERAKRRPIPQYLDHLDKTQWLSAEEIEQLQLSSLCALLVHAQTNVPYYRELFAKIGFDARGVKRSEDIAVIPVLTKDIIRARYADLVDPAHRGRNIRKGTSGSTGAPLMFEHSRDSYAWRQATRIRGYRWAGFQLGARTLHYWGQISPPKGIAGAKTRLDRAIKRDIYLDSMHSDEASMLGAVNVLRRAKPACLVVYTQSCVLWARFILDRGLRDWPDIPVVCGAEAVLPQDRAILRRAFGEEIFETYGSREVMLMSAECEAHDGMHLSEENVLLEVLADGKSCAVGEPGDVVVTDLHNLGFPFIRYANGDVATMHDSAPCRCGRGLRKLKGVDGRRADTLTDKEGRPVPGMFFHVLFGDTRNEFASQFQVIQRRDRSVTLKVVRGPGWKADTVRWLETRANDYLHGLPIRIEECDSIPQMPNGKRKTVIVET